MMDMGTALAALNVVLAAPAAAPSPQERAPERPSSAATVDELVIVAPKRPEEPAWASNINFDVRREYEQAKPPYWRRPLEKGCRVTTAGLACVRKF